MRTCACGGEMHVDYFDPIKRPLEWFMRCGTCGETGPSFVTTEEAKADWAAKEVA